MLPISITWASLLGLLILGGLFLYRAAFPKPLPGIPYDKTSARTMFGDLPAMLAEQRRTKTMLVYMRQKCVELDEPLIQAFVKPFQRPWVVLCDGREAQDIMTHRTREFDRSPVFGDVLRAIVPQSQVGMQTDHSWRFNRSLVNDVMSPGFLDNTAALRVSEAASNLIQLWKEKARLAKGHVFDVKQDLLKSITDVIWIVTFGSDLGICKSEIEYLSKIDQISLPGNDKICADMPTREPTEAFFALMSVFASLQIPIQSPFGWYAHWWAIKTHSSLRRAVWIMDNLISEQIRDACKRFADSTSLRDRNTTVKAAVDLAIKREVNVAQNERRVPMQVTTRRRVRDELSLFLLAGSTTTAEMLAWGVKYLTAFQDVQSTHRESVIRAHPGKLSATDIANKHIPYLEAFINETLRHGSNIGNLIRRAKVDTQVLGCAIPKGTDVFLMLNGPSFCAPPLLVEENKRSEGSQRAGKESLEKWNMPNLESFDPERWLVRNTAGDIEFNPRAAPMQTFGEGPRSCFGRKLAYLELRILYILILKSFELLPIDPSLLDFNREELLTMPPLNARVKLRPIEA